MNVSIQANTDGKGPNTEEVLLMLVNKIGLGYQSITMYPDDPFTGQLRAHFDGTGLGRGAWLCSVHGHVCGDKLWLREFKQGLRALGLSRAALQDLNHGELSMQASDYVSMDVGSTFYASWSRLVKKGTIV